MKVAYDVPFVQFLCSRNVMRKMGIITAAYIIIGKVKLARYFIGVSLVMLLNGTKIFRKRNCKITLAVCSWMDSSRTLTYFLLYLRFKKLVIKLGPNLLWTKSPTKRSPRNFSNEADAKGRGRSDLMWPKKAIFMKHTFDVEACQRSPILFYPHILNVGFPTSLFFPFLCY